MSNKTKKDKKILVLIDSNALIHRAFHALPPLTTKEGKPSGAVYGVALTLLSVFGKFKPDYVAAAFDMKEKTFRHKKFKEYKAKRIKAPDELYEQIPMTKELMSAFGIPVFEKKGFEADDIIGTISKNKKLDGDIERIIVTGDMDALQLVDKDTKVFTLRRGIKDTFIYDEKQVYNRFSLKPDQIIDYKALRGDPSDNIPGVAGVGEKTATELLKKYKTVDGVYDKLKEIIPDGLKKKLKVGKKSAYLSQELAEIKIDVPINFDLKEAGSDEIQDSEKLIDFFEEMGFGSLVKRISSEQAIANSKKKKEVRIKLVDNEEALEKIIKQIKKEKKFSFWILVNNENFLHGNIKDFHARGSSQKELGGIGIYFGGNSAYFIKNAYLRSLQDIFEDEKIEKIGFNIKFAMQALQKEFIGQDIQIMAYLLGSNAENIEKLIMSEFGEELSYTNNKEGQGSLLNNTNEAKQKDVAEKATLVMRLHEEYSSKLGKTASLLRVYKELELPLIPILAGMEVAGVKVDKAKLNDVSDLAEKKITELKKDIYKLAGEKFNINSPSQVAPILFEKLGISTNGIKRGKTGFSTNADQLRKIHDLHPIVALIEEYREFSKIKSTYADALPLLVSDNERIHANFNQAVTATGRLSSSDPNLQNIPKKGRLASTIREAFIAGQNKVLVSADYSQIDLRVAAHLSGDSKMIKAFEEGKDIHRSTAAWVNKVSEDEIDKKKRSEAKSLNFGILYGMGLYGFMRDSGVSMERAKFFIDHYKKTFSGLTAFIEETKEEARDKGYVETEMGRRRYIPNIKASNVMLRNAAERMAINLPIQGLAADIMKLAMIKVSADYELNTNIQKCENKKSSGSTTGAKKTGATLILQIHDELIFEVDKKLASSFSKDVKKIMEGAYKLKVPLVVDVNKGKNWKEL